MYKSLLKSALAGIGAAVLLTGCTLSEPDNSENGESAQNLRLKEVVGPMNITMVRIDYDLQGRVKTVETVGSEVVEISYTSAGTPDRILFTSYGERYGSDDTFERYIEETLEWTNIKCNAAGYIVSTDSRETAYEYNGTVITEENFIETMKYDNEGHLTETATSDGEKTVLVWENGVLTHTYDDDNSGYTNDIYYEYSQAANPMRQWDPLNMNFAGLSVTGLMGVGPDRFIKSVTEDGYMRAVSYYLMDNGLINRMRVFDEGYESGYRFVYENTNGK